MHISIPRAARCLYCETRRYTWQMVEPSGRKRTKGWTYYSRGGRRKFVHAPDWSKEAERLLKDIFGVKI
jgi:hypothetical protein